jgi:hypothetical protein
MKFYNFWGIRNVEGEREKNLGDNMKIPFLLLSENMKPPSILIIIYTFL